MNVTLTTSEIAAALQVAYRRQMEAVERKLPGRHGAADVQFCEALRRHINGAGGELAFAKALGIYWDAGVNTFKAPDVGGFQVRTRSKATYDLIVREGDSDMEVFVLVVGEMPDYRIVGGIRGARAKRDEWLRDHGGHGRAWFVPQSALKPFDLDWRVAA